MKNDKPKCSRSIECDSYKLVGCQGCGFQHFDCINSNGNTAISFLKDEFFGYCSTRRKGPGGRVALDHAVKKLILEKAKSIIQDFPDLKLCKDLSDKICIGGQEYPYSVKCDGAFSFNLKHIFYEIKGYGTDTNSILSAITAAQLITYTSRFKKHKYYYLGLSPMENGLKREDYHKGKIKPYVIWAEEKRFLKFFGIGDVNEMLEDIKNYCLA